MSMHSRFLIKKIEQDILRYIKKRKDFIILQFEEIVRQFNEIEVELYKVDKKYTEMNDAINQIHLDMHKLHEQFEGEIKDKDTKDQFDESIKTLKSHIQNMKLDVKRIMDERINLFYKLKTLDKQLQYVENYHKKLNIAFSYLKTKRIGDLAKNIIEEKEYTALALIEAQENEKKRIAREIHDGTAQSLAQILMQQRYVEKLYQEKQYEKSRREYEIMRQDTEKALAEVRKLIFDLRPMSLDDYGLIPNIERFLYEEEKRSSIPIDLSVDNYDGRLEPDIETAIYRIIQEAVHNAIKHAHASKIQVTLSKHKGEIVIKVADNGIGFSLDDVSSKSFGLTGIKERVDILNGELSIHSNEKEGTEIVVIISYL